MRQRELTPEQKQSRGGDFKSGDLQAPNVDDLVTEINATVNEFEDPTRAECHNPKFHPNCVVAAGGDVERSCIETCDSCFDCPRAVQRRARGY